MDEIYNTIRSCHDVIQRIGGKFELVSGLHVVDARSSLGVYTLNLAKPLKLIFENNNAESLELLRPFLCEEESL
jgi:hypothetical protein